MCTQRRTRKHNWECVQRLQGCLTTSLVCLRLCVLRLFSCLLPLSPSTPLSLRLSLLTGVVGKQVEGVFTENRHHAFPLFCLRRKISVLGWRYELLLGDNGECGSIGRDNSLSRSEVKLRLSPGCRVFPPSRSHTKCSSHNCEAALAEKVIHASYWHAILYVIRPQLLAAHCRQQFTYQPCTSKPNLNADAIM